MTCADANLWRNWNGPEKQTQRVVDFYRLSLPKKQAPVKEDHLKNLTKTVIDIY